MDRYPADRYHGLERYVRIAALLPRKGARDVALRIRWLLVRTEVASAVLYLTGPQSCCGAMCTSRASKQQGSYSQLLESCARREHAETVRLTAAQKALRDTAAGLRLLAGCTG